MAGKSEAVLKWLCTYEGTPPKLSAMPADVGETGVQVVQNDYERERFINGKARKRYTITLQYIADWSAGNDSVNVRSMRYGENWLDWVAEQWKAHNVPDFGESASINNIEPLYNSPDIAEVFQAAAAARYQFSAFIDYIE